MYSDFVVIFWVYPKFCVKNLLIGVEYIHQSGGFLYEKKKLGEMQSDILNLNSPLQIPILDNDNNIPHLYELKEVHFLSLFNCIIGES